MAEWQKTPVTAVVTAAELRNQLLALGIRSTDSCLVHTALSQFGYIPGGEQTVVSVLKHVLSQGNIVMPAQTADYSDPRTWDTPAATASAAQRIYANMPPFDRQLSPVHFIGRTPEYFRTLPGTVRSNHPLYSMTAWGQNSVEICETTTLDLPFGVSGPLQKLYALNGKVVMLGTDYESCTVLHLAESIIDRPQHREIAPVAVGDRTEWRGFNNVPLEPYDDFNRVGARFEQAQPHLVRRLAVAPGTITVVPIRPLVDFARDYYHRKDQQHQAELRQWGTVPALKTN